MSKKFRQTAKWLVDFVNNNHHVNIDLSGNHAIDLQRVKPYFKKYKGEKSVKD